LAAISGGSPSAFEQSWPKKFVAAPAVDDTETDKSYEITAELAGMDEKNVEVNRRRSRTALSR
jgi:HSP20 family molecular chaperone IbpA